MRIPVLLTGKQRRIPQQSFPLRAVASHVPLPQCLPPQKNHLQQCCGTPCAHLSPAWPQCWGEGAAWGARAVEDQCCGREFLPPPPTPGPAGGDQGGTQELLQPLAVTKAAPCAHSAVVGCQPAPMGCLWGSRGCAGPQAQPCGLHVNTARADRRQRWHRALGQTPRAGQAGSVTLP